MYDRLFKNSLGALYSKGSVSEHLEKVFIQRNYLLQTSVPDIIYGYKRQKIV